ncbi:DUF1145 domain-containing protein [Corallincola platygyrae]|uniref:DUF1145 domain-containing protein n=1 Tax=Corallincola platygyrae TaxID=1193278 RepID=A0ABW4XPG8_9GAMM
MFYKVMLPIGYLVMLSVWGVLIGNFIQPFAGDLAFILYLVAGLVVMMHLIQLAVFKGTMGARLILGWPGIIEILLFGVFALWRRWQKVLAEQAPR